MSGIGVMTIVVVGVIAVLLLGALAFVTKYYIKVDQGQALIINKTGENVGVTFSGGFIMPVFHRAEFMDISLKTVEIDRRGKEGLICADNIRADIKVTFFVRVNKTQQDVMNVAQSVGCKRASDQDKIEELFAAKFSEALKTVGKQMEFESLYQERVHFRDKILGIIGEDLNGYVLEDAAIDFLEQTPIEDLDAENILDSQGIRKITEITKEQSFRTNEFANQAKKDIGKDDLETKKALLEYDRQEADAEAKQQREIAVVRAKESAQAEEITSQEEARAQKAHLDAQQEVEIKKINKTREEQVAEKNRERVIAVEEENVKKERELQVISRERETELRRIEKDKEVEVEKKKIAEIVRDRVAVDKTVAEEEERIKDTRVLAEAKRNKDAAVIEAEGEAEQKLVIDIKEAEAQEQVAKHAAKKKLTEADAELDAADRIAKSKQRLAEGVKAEEAAPGLAKVTVKEADAAADEKKGMVEAKVLKEKMLAEAAGEEEQGMVEIRLKESRAQAIEKEGLAEAKVTREQLTAEAAGDEEKKMVEVRVKEANADATQKEGLAEAKVEEERGRAQAVAIREKLAAEASGLTEKADAMKQFDDKGLDHEEYRLQLELERDIGLEKLDKSIEIARAQAQVLGDAFKASNINIVGGDDAFFENFTKSVTVGKMVEGFMDSSPTARRAFDTVVGKNGNGEIVDIPTNGDGSPQLSALLSEMVDSEEDGERKTRLQELLAQVQQMDQPDSQPEPGE
ncbi:MAG: hypothetical protein ACQEVA_19630 [Myxococcota bacterium]